MNCWGGGNTTPGKPMAAGTLMMSSWSAELPGQSETERSVCLIMLRGSGTREGGRCEADFAAAARGRGGGGGGGAPGYRKKHGPTNMHMAPTVDVDQYDSDCWGGEDSHTNQRNKMKTDLMFALGKGPNKNVAGQLLF